MRTIRFLLVSALMALVMSMAAVSPASADVGSTKGCRGANWLSHTNTWAFFYNHRIRVDEVICRKGTKPSRYLKYVKTPTVTFTSRGFPSTERVNLTEKPHLTKRFFSRSGRLYAVRYTFNAKSCSLYAICQDWAFNFYVSTTGTRICSAGGNCDDKKYW